MAAVAKKTEELPAVRPEFRATPAGLLVRAGVAALIALVVFLVPVLTDTVKTTLNAVSAKLDTATLAELDKKVAADKQDPDAVAKDWLKSAGLA